MEVNSDSIIASKNSTKKDHPLSDDMSMSGLELLANKKKLNKKSEDYSVKIENNDKDSKDSKTKSKGKKLSTAHSKTTKISKSISNDSSDLLERQKEKEKKINKENKNDNIRREKSEMLYKLSKIHEKSKKDAGLFKLDMSFTLEEIKNEYERIKTNMENERMVKFCKQMLLMGVQGVEMMNTKFDPLGMDLVGWSESMGYSMENQDYDEVLSELYEKYKGQGKMSPEVKLLLMILGSAAMFTITKKISNMDSSDNFMSNVLNSFIGKKQSREAPNVQQNSQQSQVPLNTQHVQQFVPQNDERNYMGNFTPNNLPLAGDLHSVSSDDSPSKMKGLDKNFDTPDSIDIENIIKTMNEKKKSKSVNISNLSKIDEILSESEDITRNIQLKPKRGKAAAKTNASKKSKAI